MTKPTQNHLIATWRQILPRTWRSSWQIYILAEPERHVKQTAINNRLNALLALGCVEVERRGKEKWWRRA